MAINTGDLTPRASGAASLGVEQIGVCGFTTDIVPFCHVHANSGVYHGPYGSSGVLRYNGGKLERSDDGGITFFSLATDLQAAYDNGNEIDQEAHAPHAHLAAANFFVEHDAVVVKQTTPGAGLPDTHDIHNGFHDASIVASGFTLTPNLLSTFAHTSIGPGYFTMQGSGTVAAPERAGSIAISASNSSVLGATVGMVVSGLFVINSDGGTFWNQTGSGPIVFLNNGDFKGNGGQIQFQPFAGSGQLEYRLGGTGGHEAWHWSPSYDFSGGPNADGFHPIPNSGQIGQMILNQGGTLQAAYNAGETIVAEYPGNGPVHINGSSSWGLSLDQVEGEFPHVLMSGVNDQVNNAGINAIGSLWMQAHTAGGVAQRNSISITSREQASAKSLGIDTMFMTTGSGVVSMRSASGVSQVISLSNSADIDTTGLIVPLHFQTASNTFYGVNFGDPGSGIKILVPGQYKIHYSVVLDKTAGSKDQQVNTELRFYDRWGQSFRLLGSESAGIVHDATGLNSNTCNSQSLVDLHAGDALVIYAWAEVTPPAGNSVQTKTRATNLLIEWIGGLAGGGLIKQKV